MHNKGRPQELGELAELGLFCYYRFINRIYRIRLYSGLLNYKLISGSSDYDCSWFGYLEKDKYSSTASAINDLTNS